MAAHCCYDQRKDAKTKQTQQLLMADEQDPARPEARLHNNLSHVQNLNMQTYSISQQLSLRTLRGRPCVWNKPSMALVTCAAPSFSAG